MFILWEKQKVVVGFRENKHRGVGYLQCGFKHTWKLEVCGDEGE